MGGHPAASSDANRHRLLAFALAHCAADQLGPVTDSLQRCERRLRSCAPLATTSAGGIPIVMPHPRRARVQGGGTAVPAGGSSPSAGGCTVASSSDGPGTADGASSAAADPSPLKAHALGLLNVALSSAQGATAYRGLPTLGDVPLAVSCLLGLPAADAVAEFLQQHLAAPHGVPFAQSQRLLVLGTFSQSVRALKCLIGDASCLPAPSSDGVAPQPGTAAVSSSQIEDSAHSRSQGSYAAGPCTVNDGMALLHERLPTLLQRVEALSSDPRLNAEQQDAVHSALLFRDQLKAAKEARNVKQWLPEANAAQQQPEDATDGRELRKQSVALIDLTVVLNSRFSCLVEV